MAGVEWYAGGHRLHPPGVPGRDTTFCRKCHQQCALFTVEIGAELKILLACDARHKEIGKYHSIFGLNRFTRLLKMSRADRRKRKVVSILHQGETDETDALLRDGLRAGVRILERRMGERCRRR